GEMTAAKENREQHTAALLCPRFTLSNFSSTPRRESTVKKAMTRAILGLAVLALASVTLLAQAVPGTITINGGKNTVAMHVSKQPASKKFVEPAVKPFYSNFVAGATPYQCGVGYTVSDGAPINQEFTPASQFVSSKAGTTASIRIAVGFVTGTNGARVTLDKDCKGSPCGTIDKTHLCRGTIKNLVTFGQSC